jgi:hypothetical protein
MDVEDAAGEGGDELGGEDLVPAGEDDELRPSGLQVAAWAAAREG